MHPSRGKLCFDLLLAVQVLLLLPHVGGKEANIVLFASLLLSILFPPVPRLQVCAGESQEYAVGDCGDGGDQHEEGRPDVVGGEEDGGEGEGVRHQGGHQVAGQSHQAHHCRHIVGSDVLRAAPRARQVEAHEGVGGGGEDGDKDGGGREDEKGDAEEGKTPKTK